MIIKLIFFALTSMFFSLQSSQMTSTAIPTLLKCSAINCPCGNGIFKNSRQAYQTHYELLFRKTSRKSRYEHHQCPLCLRMTARKQTHFMSNLNRYVHDVIKSKIFFLEEWRISTDSSEKSEPIRYSSPTERAPEQQEPDLVMLSLTPLLPLFPDLDVQNALDNNFTGVNALLD